MMPPAELHDHLAQLGLTQADAAVLLGVDPRTVRRWGEGSQEIPGPAEQALRAWLRLHHRALVWRPDGEAITTDDAEMIARHREHAIGLDALLERVEARGGPAAPWQVDLERCVATLGPLHVSFYKLRNGGFSPQSYRRSDGPADTRRDWPLIEDAYACIAREFAKNGSPPRTRFAFIGPSLDNGRLSLWDSTIMPPVVAVMSCRSLRKAFGLGNDASDDKCRLLATRNMALLTEVAETLFAKGRYSVNEDPVVIRVLNIGANHLQMVADRFSRSVLNMEAKWVSP